MKAIKSQVIITSLRSRKDKSLGFSGETPELTSEEKVAWLDLQGLTLDAVFEPIDQDTQGIVEVDREVGIRTPSQKLRAVFYKLWRVSDQPGDFKDYYNQKMERLIEHFKEKLD